MNFIALKPSESYEFTRGAGDVLLIACGALAREIITLIEANRWQAFDVTCLPARLHNYPDRIAPAVEARITAARGKYKSIFVLYGDCGTGGALDKVLAKHGVERIAGPHCYAFFSGNAEFASRAEEDVTVFYLTDYLARQFDKLIWKGLGLDRHPELLPMYFGNYTKVVYLAQTRDQDIAVRAMAAAQKLGLAYEYRYVGYGELLDDLRARA
jgi:hypothetical protein